jgi:hypothetical protein
MTVVGGSHTSFDTGAFAAGALAGSGAVAGALMAGVRNVQARRQADWSAWNLAQLTAALDLSEALRERLYEELHEARRQVADRDLTLADMRRLALTARANRRRQ